MSAFFRKKNRIPAFLLAAVLAAAALAGSGPVAWGAEKDGPGAVGTDTASASAETGTVSGPGTQSVTVKLKLDGNPVPDAEVTLRQEKEVVYTMTAGPGADEFTVSSGVKDGIYNIYVDGKDSGRTLNVDGGTGSAKVTMFTVTFLMTAAGEEVETQRVFLGDTAQVPDLDGEKFEGWMTEEEKKFDFSEEISGKTVLHGKWSSLENDIDCGVENARLEGAEEVVFGEAFEGKLVPDEGYELPEDLEIFAGEEEVTDFTYDPETGVISIPEGVINGDLSIQGAGKEGESYPVLTEIVNGALVGSRAYKLSGYSGFVRPNAGYDCPQELTAAMNGEPFTEFTYNPETGDITIAAGKVNGEITFSGVCEESEGSKEYQVLCAIGHGKAYYEKNLVQEELEITIVPEEGYSVPAQVLVTTRGKRFKDFSYDSETGILKIASARADLLVISAICPVGDSMVKILHTIR